MNAPQAEAVAHVDGPLLVFAGAGSGKTRVITYRVANLVAEARVAPYRILAVTFTNKAAGEMRARLAALLGDDVAKDLAVGTFHATCARLLRRYHAAAGLERSFVIYDDGDQRSVMTRVLKELDYDDKRYPPRQVLARIHAAKQEGLGPAEYDQKDFSDAAIVKCFEGYERLLRQANAVDFDDLLLHVLRMLEDPESVAGDEMRRRFRYVLVDEFQDVNQVQYRIVRALAGATKNLCVVGDDDQSIYRWRGADVRIVRGFRRDFPGAEVVKLEQNYRSSGNVVKAALGVIKPAKEREPKELWTSNSGGEPVRVVAAENEHDEAQFVVERIRALVQGGVSAREIAVFYRVHAQSRVLEEELRKHRVPYQVIGGMRFFERAEVKDALAYLRVVANPKSDVDLLRIINVPARKIGDTTVEKLVAAADRERSSLFDAIGPLVESGDVGTAAKQALLGFRDLMHGLMVEARTGSPREVAESMLLRSGYLAMLEADDSVEAETRKQNLREVIGSIVEYEAEPHDDEDEGATLAGYLERVSLVSDADTVGAGPHAR
ncbi:MAG TPA: UvrD-helicase domain-containing protein, partial [Byssovorax sp.]